MALHEAQELSGCGRTGGGLRRLFKAGGDGVTCPDCDGDGEVEQEYEVGGYDGGPWVEYRVRWIECERCRGSGEVEDENDC